MSWTSPRTWADTTLIVAADLNEQVRDNLSHLKSLHDSSVYHNSTGSFSTTSTSYVDVTGAVLSFTPKSARQLLLVTGNTSDAVGGATTCQLAYKVDSGSDILLIYAYDYGVSGVFNSFSRAIVLTLTAGVAVSIKLRMSITPSGQTFLSNYTFLAMDIGG